MLVFGVGKREPSHLSLGEEEEKKHLQSGLLVFELLNHKILGHLTACLFMVHLSRSSEDHLAADFLQNVIKSQSFRLITEHFDI